MLSDFNPQEDPESVGIFDRNCVLIIDEDHKHLEYLTQQFEQQGFKVLSHTCGQLAMKTARKMEPDCIILDLSLLDMDGLDLCQALVDDSKTCGIPVVVTGKTTDTAVIQKAKAAGSEFFVAKPVDPKNLLMLVNESIAEARSWICD